MRQIVIYLQQILSLLREKPPKPVDYSASMARIEALLVRICDLLTPPAPVRFRITWSSEMPKVTSATVDFTINENGTGTATLTPVDANGNDTTMPAGASVPAWVSSDPDISVAATVDGLSATVTAGTTPTTGATISVSSTLADGSTISGMSDPIDVVAAPPGAAVRFRIAMSASPSPAGRH